MNTTCHSEYLPIAELLIKNAQFAFVSQENIDAEYQELNYLFRPDWQESILEYQAFEHLLNREVDAIKSFPKAENTGMDSMYCRDASIATDFGMIICRMGKGGRVGEPEAQRDFFLENGQEVLGVIEAPGTLEGGDVAWLDRKTLAVGRTYRSNASGIQQLKALLEPKGIEVIVAHMPHYKGPQDVFHLMSVLSPVDEKLAVVYPPLMPIPFLEVLTDRGFDFVEVPDEEFESMACNVLAIGPSKCLMVEGNPKTKEALERKGCTVFTYSGANISVAGGGGPTCLTRPLKRKLL